MPPVAARVCEYAVPTCPFGREEVETIRVAGTTVSDRLTVAVWAGEPESVTLNVNAAFDTAAVGVPPISPVAAVKVSPAGRVPAVRVQE